MPIWIQIILRSILLITILFFLTKWLGKKQLSQMNSFEFISGFVLASIAAIHSIDVKLPLIYGILSMFTWFFIPFILKQLTLKNKTLRDFIQGKSTVLIQNGKIMEDNLKKESYSTDDLLENLREKNIFHVADVEFALLEPFGRLSVLPKKENQPLTPKHAGITVAPMKEPQTVIMDGKMLLEPLANLSLNPDWLTTELEKMNVTIENVFLGQVDHNGQLSIDLYDDQLVVPESTEKELLLATMKKCQADLELFALATKNEQSKQIYSSNSKKLDKAIEAITPFLQ